MSFTTDWEALAFIALFVAVPAVGVWLVVRRDPAVPPLKRRPSGPPACGAATGTGVECGPRPTGAADLAAPPRSHPVAGDPRPPATGPVLPAGVAVPYVTPAGVHRRPVVIHDW